MITTNANSVRSLLQHNLLQYNVNAIIHLSTPFLNMYYEQNIHKLEMVQRRAARFVMSNYNRTASVTEMLNSLYNGKH